MTLHRITTWQALSQLPGAATARYPQGAPFAQMLFCGGDTQEFGPGDCLFVQAGPEHRFTRFDEDFITWVIFYGPQGGEANTSSLTNSSST